MQNGVINWSGAVSAAAGATRDQAMLRAVFESANHLIIVTRPDGIIIDMNPAAERALGWRREEVVGRLTPEVIHHGPEVAARAAELSRRLGRPVPAGFETFVVEARQGLPSENEWTYVRKDGRHFPVLLSVTGLWDDGGELMGFVGISTDLSERRAREAAVQAAEREAEARRIAERADKAKSRFLAAASHDLRQPLQAVRLLLEALRPRLSGAPEREILRCMDEALGAGETLLRRLLDLSLIEAGTVQPRRTSFDINALLQRQAEEFAPLAAEKGLRLRVRARPMAVKSDEVLLRRLIRNLVVNALNYTEEGGILVGVRRRGGIAWVEVWDSGIGIAAEHLDAIFDSFYQVGNQERVAAQGHGLGLAIVKRTADLLGHPLRVRSWPGQGSLFAVGVPLAET